MPATEEIQNAKWGILDPASWKEAHRIYQPNVVQMVSPRWAILSWAYHLFQARPPRPERCDFRVSIAEMQRMYMTALQSQLVDLGIQLRWPSDLAQTVNELPLVLEKYSTVLTIHQCQTLLTRQG
jgi:hypothetical protein